MRNVVIVLGAVVPVAGLWGQQQRPFRVQLTNSISTRTNQKGDKVTAVVITPAEYRGDTMEGTIKECTSGGVAKKKSTLSFGFAYLFHQNQRLSVRSEITGFVNSKGKANVDEEGQIVEKKNDIGKALLITGIGAGIGAAAGGAKGAAIGSGAGAAVGLLFIRFGSKAPNLTFNAGSQFDLMISSRRE